MRPAFPALTFPSHYSMVTGLHPDRHGIVNNTMTDATIPGVTFSPGNRLAVQDRRWWDAATPLWVSAERQGIRSATMNWPGSEAPVQGMRPSDWREYDGNFPGAARVDTVLDWLDRPTVSRPAFITLYLDDIDTAGHRFGPDSAQNAAAIQLVDKAIGRLVDGLAARGKLRDTNLVIVSDHGMAATAKERVVWLDDIIDTATVAPFGNGGPFLGIQPLPGNEADVAKALQSPHAHLQCWTKENMPVRFDYGRHPRVPPVICMAETGWWISTRALAARNPPSGGAHGFDPEDPLMSALFMAHGPSFKRGQALERAETVDVYPLLATLIGVKPLSNQGNLAAFERVLKP